MHIGVDWGGTKLEVIVLTKEGEERFRERIPTPSEGYEASIVAVCDLIAKAEQGLGTQATIGFGIPGTISPATGLVKNANSQWLNGMPLKRDLEAALGREVRVQNDANCFAVSEAIDGAGAGCKVVAGVIIGTGCGSGIAIDGVAHVGRHGIGGEFGHTPLAWLKDDEYPGPECWCGRRGCLETWISGTGFERDYYSRYGQRLSAQEILSSGSDSGRECLDRYCDRLARGLAVLVNIVDPDVIVLGGGMSNVDAIYDGLNTLMKPYVFSDVFETPIKAPVHGDSSGVRGAAWLWK